MISVFSGDPVEDIETAKRLIANYPDVDLEMLITVASDQQAPVSARVAAIYTLGFTDDRAVSRPVLTDLVSSQEPAIIRDHAVEALGYMDDTQGKRA